MSKLTLSVDHNVIRRAKDYVSRHATSVSALVERYLDAISRKRAAAAEDLPPITKRLSGALRGARHEREHYIEYLEQKYR